MIAFLRRFFPKKPEPPDTYLNGLAREQQEVFDKFAALPYSDPSKMITWWEYRFIQNRRTNAIVDDWHRVKVR